MYAKYTHLAMSIVWFASLFISIAALSRGKDYIFAASQWWDVATFNKSKSIKKYLLFKIANPAIYICFVGIIGTSIATILNPIFNLFNLKTVIEMSVTLSIPISVFGLGAILPEWKGIRPDDREWPKDWPDIPVELVEYLTR